MPVWIIDMFYSNYWWDPDYEQRLYFQPALILAWCLTIGASTMSFAQYQFAAKYWALAIKVPAILKKSLLPAPKYMEIV